MGGNTNQNGTTGNQRLYNVATTSSVLGQALNVVIGTRKTNMLLFYQDGFSSNPISKKAAGGKGGGKSGQYNYSADVVVGVSAGPISGIGNIWTGQSFLGALNAAEQFAITSTSFTFTGANASTATNNFGVTPSANFSTTTNDFGAPSPTEVSATTSTPFTQVPVGTTPGQGEYTYSNGTYTFSPEDAGKTVTAAYSFLLTTINQQETDIIPSTLQIAVSPEFPFQADLGVVFSSTTASNDGVALQKVNGTPTKSGTYSVQGSGPAVYRFASADEGAQITITFQITDTGIVSAGESNQLDFTLATGEIGQQPYAFLTSSFPQAALGYTGIATLLFEPMQLGPSAEIQQNSFEVISGDQFGGVYATTNLPILDCNPVQILLKILTNAQWGMGTGAQPFPVSVIDNGPGGTWGEPGTPSVQQSGSTAYNWFAANNLFFSALLDSQDTASSTIGKMLEAGMCAAYVSEGLLKLVPYGDTTVAANGCTWTAPTQAVVALDDTSFLAKPGADPVEIDRSDWQDAWNGCQITYQARAFQYNSETIQESDQGLINRFGSRLEDPQDWDFICELPAAQAAANLRLKRQTYIRNTYKFSLPFNYSYIEPMDIVTITTSSVWDGDVNNENLGIVNLPVRITKVVDNPGEDGLQFEAEDYLSGVGSATIFNKGINTSNPAPNTQANPGTSEVVLFEAAGRLVSFGGNQIWLGCCGTSNNYGGTNVFVSQDNEDFVQVAQTKQISVLGTLAEAFPAGEEQDTVNSLVVTLAENSAGLVSATQQAAENLTTLCYVDGEVIAFSTAALTGQNTWTMNQFILRGQMGTTISAHAAGSLFLRLDGSITKYTYDPTANGQTLFMKFAPFNVFGNAQPPLSQIQSVSLTLSATNSGTIDASSGLIEQGSVNGLTGTLTGINTTIAGLSASTTANLTVLADMSSVSFLTPSEQIAFIAQFNAMISTQTSLDATAKSLGVSSSAYDAAVANVSTQLIAAGAPSNFASTWPTMTTFGPATDIQTDLNNLFAEVASQQAALQSEISAQQASTAQAAAVATAASNSLTQINTAVTTLNEQAPTVVSSLPTLPNSSFPPGKYVFDSTNNELVVVNAAGTAFTNLTVPAANIAGTLSAAQVASLAASQITGQLTASQIASIAAAQVSGQLTAGQIASVSATTVTGELTASQIASVQAASLLGAVGSGNSCANGDFAFTEQADGAGAATGLIPINFEVYNNGNTPVTSSVTTGGAIGTANFWRIQALASTANTFGFFIDASEAIGGFQNNINYVVSFYARCADTPSEAGNIVSLAFNDPPATTAVLENPGLTTSFQRYAFVVNWGSAPVDPDIFFNFNNPGPTWPSGAALDISNVQVQQGDALTGWAPPAVTAANPINPISAATLIGAGSISTGQIAANAIQAGQLAANSVTAAAIEAGTITATQIAASTITGGNIAAGTITAGEIAAGTITGAKISGGTITGSNLVANTITAGQLAANSVTAAAIEAGTITSAQIAAGTIEASNIASATITGGQIAANTISGNNIQAGTITGNNIQAGTITAGQIAAGAIGATQIAADSISTSQLTVADLTNNVYNPGFEAGLTSWVSQSPSTTVISTAQAHSGAQSLELTPVSGAFAIINANVVPAVPGQQFIEQVFVMATNGTSGNVNLRMYWYEAGQAPSPGGTANAIDAGTFDITTSWVQQTANFTVPANAVAVQFAIVFASITGGDVFIDDCYFRRMTDGSLIVDGSISSANIVTGGLSANVLTSGSINADVVSVTNLNASNITTGTLDATSVVFSDGSSVNTASRVIVAQSTISSAVSVISTDPVPTGLGFTFTAEQPTDVINLWATLAIFPFVSIVVSVVEDNTIISQTTLAESQNVFFFSASNFAGAHELKLSVALATTQTSGIQPVLNPTSSGTYMIGQLIF